jgi:hypothetical protein
MSRTEETLVMWQIVNLLRDLQCLLNRRYFDEFLELDDKESAQTCQDEWLFPKLKNHG